MCWSAKENRLVVNKSGNVGAPGVFPRQQTAQVDRLLPLEMNFAVET